MPWRQWHNSVLVRVRAILLMQSNQKQTAICCRFLQLTMQMLLLQRQQTRVVHQTPVLRSCTKYASAAGKHNCHAYGKAVIECVVLQLPIQTAATFCCV
jgi:hypothetical protein